jgi:ApbE superfamily uncharacterized protein (UPF0280 family)
MFTTKVTIQDRTKRVKAAADKAAFRNYAHAAASIRKDAAASIVKSPDPSEPGEPPHTRKRLLPRAMRFAVDKEGAVIGPRASIAGQAGSVHELGGSYKGQTFPERPYMKPALDRAIPRFAGSWQGAIGE